jgi:hypothetical protein
LGDGVYQTAEGITAMVMRMEASMRMGRG